MAHATRRPLRRRRSTSGAGRRRDLVGLVRADRAGARRRLRGDLHARRRALPRTPAFGGRAAGGRAPPREAPCPSVAVAAGVETVPHHLALGGRNGAVPHRWAKEASLLRRSGRGLLPQEDRGWRIPQGGAAVPQAAQLRCPLQEPHGRFAGTLTQRHLTKRSREESLETVRKVVRRTLRA